MATVTGPGAKCTSEQVIRKNLKSDGKTPGLKRVCNTNMDKPQSKETSQDGITNININEELENNTYHHQAHELKLWFILAINILQLMWMLRKMLKKKWRREGFDRARSISRDELDSVKVNN